MIVNVLKSKFLKNIALLIVSSLTIMSCQKDDSTTPEAELRLTTISGNEINMNGIWSTGCVAANNNMILNESLTFNNENLKIDIKGYDNFQCNGATTFSETIVIAFNYSGTTRVFFEGEEVIVNKIDGTATYTDGSVEVFKQIFLIDDNGDDIYMHHALFENDGGDVNTEDYPIDLIPISINKTN